MLGLGLGIVRKGLYRALSAVQEEGVIALSAGSPRAKARARE